MKKTYDELKNEAIEMLEEDDNLFCDMVEEIDSWNGFADGFRCYPMDEIDEIFSGVSIGDFLDKLAGDFNHRQNYFVDTIYGLESADYKEEVYRDNTSSEEVLEEVLEYSGRIYIGNSEFKELVEALVDYEEEEEEEEEEQAAC